MKTIEQIKNYSSEGVIDGRDVSRLLQFIEVEDWSKLGVELKKGVTIDDAKKDHEVKEFTREAVLENLKSDLEFAFNKALDQRGISASLMFNVIMMWNWILEDGLEDWDADNYAQYGLPLLKATALKYDFHNPIGNDNGDEADYASF